MHEPHQYTAGHAIREPAFCRIILGFPNVELAPCLGFCFGNLTIKLTLLVFRPGGPDNQQREPRTHHQTRFVGLQGLPEILL